MCVHLYGMTRVCFRTFYRYLYRDDSSVWVDR